MKPQKSNATAPTMDAKQQLAAIRLQAKAIREQLKAAHAANAEGRKSEKIETWKKYIAIFNDRANRLEAKAKKARALALMLSQRIEKATKVA